METLPPDVFITSIYYPKKSNNAKLIGYSFGASNRADHRVLYNGTHEEIVSLAKEFEETSDIRCLNLDTGIPSILIPDEVDTLRIHYNRKPKRSQLVCDSRRHELENRVVAKGTLSKMEELAEFLDSRFPRLKFLNDLTHCYLPIDVEINRTFATRKTSELGRRRLPTRERNLVGYDESDYYNHLVIIKQGDRDDMIELGGKIERDLGILYKGDKGDSHF